MRRATWIIGAAIVAAGLVGCAPGGGSGETKSPVASPTPTDDVQSAREAVLTYIAASNQVDFSDPSTFQAVFDSVLEPQLQYEQRTLGDFHTEGWTHSGESRVRVLDSTDRDPTSNVVVLAVCIDTSEIEYRDASGTRKVPVDALLVTPMDATVELDSSGQWRLSNLAEREGDPKCT